MLVSCQAAADFRFGSSLASASRLMLQRCHGRYACFSFLVSEASQGSVTVKGRRGRRSSPPHALTTSTTCWAAIRPSPPVASLCRLPSVLKLRFIFLLGISQLTVVTATTGRLQMPWKRAACACRCGGLTSELRSVPTPTVRSAKADVEAAHIPQKTGPGGRARRLETARAPVDLLKGSLNVQFTWTSLPNHALISVDRVV